MGVRLDTNGHAHHDRLHDPCSRCGVGNPDDLLERVDDDAADSRLNGAFDIGHRLVVAMHDDAITWDPSSHCDLELTGRCDVKA